MPLLSVEAENAAWDACYGSGRAGSWPAEVEYQLWDGDPRIDGTAELDATGGYAAVVVDNDDTAFPAATGGEKVGAVVTFPTSTDAWSATATWLVLADPATGRLLDGVPLAEDIVITTAGVTKSVQVALFHEEDTGE